MELLADWKYVSDSVMGGVSSGRIKKGPVDGRSATRLLGEVSLDNNGGFLQMAFDLCSNRHIFDASEFLGVELDVLGNDQSYEMRLRTDQLIRPWQSYRIEFRALDKWTSIRLPFNEFKLHKTDIAFDQSRLKRLGILAIGREFKADISVSRIQFFR